MVSKYNLQFHCQDTKRIETYLFVEILEYHVVPHIEYSAELHNREYLRTLVTHLDVIRLGVSSKLIWIIISNQKNKVSHLVSGLLMNVTFCFRYKWCLYQPPSPRDTSRHQCHQWSSTYHWSRAYPIQISIFCNLGKEVVSWTNVIWTKFHIHCIITLYICKYLSPILFELECNRTPKICNKCLKQEMVYSVNN